MRRSVQVIAPLLASTAALLLADCGPEMPRCVDPQSTCTSHALSNGGFPSLQSFSHRIRITIACPGGDPCPPGGDDQRFQQPHGDRSTVFHASDEACRYQSSFLCLCSFPPIRAGQPFSAGRYHRTQPLSYGRHAHERADHSREHRVIGNRSTSGASVASRRDNLSRTSCASLETAFDTIDLSLRRMRAWRFSTDRCESSAQRSSSYLRLCILALLATGDRLGGGRATDPTGGWSALPL